MRILSPEAGEVDLVERYAYPSDGVWLRANMVASLDGAAQRDERSGGLGNAADRRLFLLLRGLADVVLVGANTVRAEGYGPVLPADTWDGVRDGRAPVPPLAVVSRTLDLDYDAPLFTEARARTIVLTTATADPARLAAARERADVIVAGQESLDFPAAVAELAARGHRRLLCEGGPAVLAQVLAAGLLDELCLTLSPQLLAGRPARILNGPPLPVPPELTLAHVLRDDDFLFLRYTR
ncbi:riboflavin biosynthesis pyrimidine reductase [Actinomadura pelletieri DSM 43383]|uniref:Riboflavin biosynthesis pyrimidine reductase n=1 Tax=Actinomadura pelletieri DSM 43383 TaxID=1120940 RepID=A0A495QB41_9ACTN|nr:pyrimidine reductase family protein [Actinomadura pelletieri]RKS68912.1 riboflavin biosynthesis pyrimidine reductase [Actinomadura pelletieri DSM 43383]